MLEYLEEEGITIYEDQPDLDVFYAYNKFTQGFETYQEHVEHIRSQEEQRLINEAQNGS